jgi:hypothetical protein
MGEKRADLSMNLVPLQNMIHNRHDDTHGAHTIHMMICMMIQAMIHMMQVHDAHKLIK